MLGRVRVDERVDRLGAALVRVVDLHERLPLVGERVLREDRLDRALRLARAAVDALLRIDDQHPAELVDAVDRTDVHAGAIFDVDARLGDDVRHAASLARGSERRRGQLGDETGDALDERRLDEHLVEAGRVRALQARLVGVVREADDRDVRPRVDDLVGLDARDVADHEVGQLDAVGRDQVVPLEQRLELPPKEEVDSREQDRRHRPNLAARELAPGLPAIPSASKSRLR